MKQLSHLRKPDQLFGGEKSVPKMGLIASLYVTNLLGGNEGEWLDENRIEDLKFEGGEWVMKIGGKPGDLWGKGAVSILEENRCKAELFNPDISYDNPTSRYILVKVPELVVRRIEQRYKKDVEMIVEDLKRRATEIVDDEDENERKLAA